MRRFSPNLKQLTAVTAVVCAALSMGAKAQNSPAPGPTNPIPPNPQSKSGATIVVNPTVEECRRGWEANMRWTKDQFEQFCMRLGASK
jgi:hypothetical protein